MWLLPLKPLSRRVTPGCVPHRTCPPALARPQPTTQNTLKATTNNSSNHTPTPPQNSAQFRIPEFSNGKSLHYGNSAFSSTSFRNVLASFVGGTSHDGPRRVPALRTTSLWIQR